MEKHDQNRTVATGNNGNAAMAPLPKGAPFGQGDVIGGAYRVMDMLGQGGMGFVYRVEHMMMTKQMALKVLRADQVSSTIWRRFQTEAQAIARLDHVNIVKIYDMSQTPEGVPYYTMDLLIGEALCDYLDRMDMMPVKDALPVFRQVCAGLAYAHDRGIIHRDIKPPNIMLLSEPREVVKIVDFGIAKLTALDGGADQNLTRPGEIFGSPLYMSPEQCLGETLDHRTDIYSVGVTFFEALTGRPPFVGRTAVETTVMHHSSELPTLAERGEGEYPKELERIVAKLMAKNPDRRYQSLAETASDLLQLETNLDREARGLPPLTLRPAAGTRSGSAISVVPYATQRSIQDAAQHQNLFEDENDGDQDEDDDEIEAKAPNRFIIPVSILAVLLACISVIVYLVVLKSSDSKKAHEVPPQIAAPAQSKKGTAAAIDSASAAKEKKDNSTIESEQKLAASCKAASAPGLLPFSRLIKKSGKIFRRFDFPFDMSLGSLVQSGKPTIVKSATGSFDLPDDAQRSLDPSYGAFTYPAVLRRFQTGDFTIFRSSNFDNGDDGMIQNISHINSIDTLIVGRANITDGCLPAMNKLTNLRDLVINDTNITGAGLAATKIPQRLSSLNFREGTQISKLLQAMRGSTKIIDLSIEDTHLTAADIEVISTMPNLETLNIGSNDITAKDLEPLAKLKKLLKFDLNHCELVSGSSLKTLSQMTSLKQINIGVKRWSKAEQERLLKVLPNTSIKNTHTKQWLRKLKDNPEQDESYE